MKVELQAGETHEELRGGSWVKEGRCDGGEHPLSCSLKSPDEKLDFTPLSLSNS